MREAFDEAIAKVLRGASAMRFADVGLVAVRADGSSPDPLALALSEGLGPDTKPGRVLARLLDDPPGQGPWVIALVRRAGGPPTAREFVAAQRIVAAATALGMRVDRVLLISDRAHWLLATYEATT